MISLSSAQFKPMAILISVAFLPFIIFGSIFALLQRNIGALLMSHESAPRSSEYSKQEWIAHRNPCVCCGSGFVNAPKRSLIWVLTARSTANLCAQSRAG